jgi:chromosome segregation ATPase
MGMITILLLIAVILLQLIILLKPKDNSIKNELADLKKKQNSLIQQNEESLKKLKQMDNTVVITHKKIVKLDSVINSERKGLKEAKREVQNIPTDEVKQVFDNIFPPSSTGGSRPK